MNIPNRRERLRPYTFLEVLDRTFRIYRDDFALFIIPVAAVHIPLTALSIYSSLWLLDRLRRAGFDPTSVNFSGASNPFLGAAGAALLTDLLVALGFTLLLGVVGAFVSAILINGLLAYIASESHLGRKPTLGEAFAAVRERFVPLVVGHLVFYLILSGAFIVLTLILFACGLGLGLLVYLGLALYAFLAPVLVLERTGAVEGLGRSWTLGKSRIWPIFGLTAAMTVGSFLINLVLNAVLPDAVGGSQLILQIVIEAIPAILLAPIAPIGYTLLYYDARVRLEGLDIAFNALEKADPRPADVASPTPVGRFMANDDFVNLAILTALMFVLILAYVGISLATASRAARLF